MSGLLVILKNKFQQCQEKHAKGHQVLEVIVLHKHHLHSTRECRQHHPATRLSVSCLIVTYVIENIQRTNCEFTVVCFFSFRQEIYL